MVNKKDQDKVQDDVEITNEDTEMNESELEEIEGNMGLKLKSLRTKLTAAETTNKELREEVQRTKADFLNAKRRLEEDRARDKERLVVSHVSKLLPLYDSFHMAMLDKKVWEKADEEWRKGIEGIFSQLQNVMASYQVSSFDPTGDKFDPVRHDALNMMPVEDPNLDHTVLAVIQLGFEQTIGENKTVIRPARVSVGEYTK